MEFRQIDERREILGKAEEQFEFKFEFGFRERLGQKDVALVNSAGKREFREIQQVVENAHQPLEIYHRAIERDILPQWRRGRRRQELDEQSFVPNQLKRG